MQEGPPGGLFPPCLALPRPAPPNTGEGRTCTAQTAGGRPPPPAWPACTPTACAAPQNRPPPAPGEPPGCAPGLRRPCRPPPPRPPPPSPAATFASPPARRQRAPHRLLRRWPPPQQTRRQQQHLQLVCRRRRARSLRLAARRAAARPGARAAGALGNVQRRWQRPRAAARSRQAGPCTAGNWGGQHQMGGEARRQEGGCSAQVATTRFTEQGPLPH